MNSEKILIGIGKKQLAIANRWELLFPDQFTFLVGLLSQYALKNATMDDVRLHYVCHALGVDLTKITNPEAMSNLIVIADQIDFIFNESGKLNICFLKQLVPFLKTMHGRWNGYTVNTSFETLTCSITAAQFIDATELANSNADKLPLLAAILYKPLYSNEPYSSEKAHEFAKEFTTANPLDLQAVSLNFQALTTYLFTKTHFSLLSSDNKKSIPEISTGMLETMLNLSTDGMGDVNTVKQMPVIEFLTILRKKLIESVRAMHDAKIDIVKIADATGLNTKTIKKMI